MGGQSYWVLHQVSHPRGSFYAEMFHGASAQIVLQARDPNFRCKRFLLTEHNALAATHDHGNPPSSPSVCKCGGDVIFQRRASSVVKKRAHNIEVATKRPHGFVFLLHSLYGEQLGECPETDATC